MVGWLNEGMSRSDLIGLGENNCRLGSGCSLVFKYGWCWSVLGWVSIRGLVAQVVPMVGQGVHQG